MGASSVTGVSGYGSAEATSKGPKERNFVGVEKLIGPRVILATQVTLLAGVGALNFGDVGDPTENCVVASAANAVTVTKVLDGVTGHLLGVTLAGVGADVVDIMLIKVGNAL